MRISQRRLATVWFIGAAIIVLLQVTQSIAGRFGDNVNDAWGWLLPNLMPTLSLIVAVLVLEEKGQNKERRIVDRFVYRLTLSLSIVYLLLLLTTILAKPLMGVSVLAAMKQSNLWLGPIQGLTSAALGAFFIQNKEQKA